MKVIERPAPIFTDVDGSPLEAGYVYVGVVNQNPETNPVSVYWDAAMTQPAAQPLRTSGGALVNAGSFANLYVAGDYSITVKNKNGSLICTFPNSANFGSNVGLSSSSGAASVGWIQSGTGAVLRTVQDKLRDIISVKDFGAVGNGVADDSAAFLAAHNAAGSTAFILVPAGTYLINSAVTVTGRYFLLDGGTITNSANLTGANIVALSAFAKSGTNSDITSLTAANLTLTQLLSVNGGQLAGRRNKIINGTFDVWQLGTNFTVSSHLQKLADRWNFDWNGTLGTLIVQQSGPVVVASDLTFKNGVRLTQTGGASGNTFYDFSTQIESVHTLQGKQVTISFYAYSASANNQITVKTEQYFGGGGSPSSPVFNTSSPVTITQGSWNRYSVTFTMASTAGKTLGSNGDDTMNVIFTLPVNTTFDFYITGVQIEQGPVATPFETIPFADTFQMCQRYLQTSYDNGTAPGTATAQGVVAFQAGGPNPLTTLQLKTPMRVLPSMTYYNPATGAAGTWNDGGTARAVATNTNGTKNVSVAVTGSAAGNFITGHYVAQDPYY